MTAGRTASDRLAAAAIVGGFLFTASFFSLALLHAFRLWIALPLWALSGFAAHRLGGREASALLRADLSRGRTLLTILWATRLRFVLIAATTILAARLLRGLWAPMLGWDALTYHLFKAGQWVQAGSLTAMHAPDAWGAYDYFPPYGEALWAWVLLSSHTDALMAPAGVLVWMAVLGAGYAAARSMGTDEIRATLVALTIALFPAVVNYVTAANVDNTALAYWLLGITFVIRCIADPSIADVMLGIGALALAAGTKATGLPILLLGFVVVVWSFRKHAQRGRMFAAAMLAVLVAVPPYVRAWMETGSPLYPFGLNLLGHTIFTGNAEHELLFSGKLLPHSFSWAHLFHGLFVPAFWHPQNLGLGPGAIIIALLAAVGFSRLVRRPSTRVSALFLFAIAALIAIGLTSNDVLAQRTRWVHVLGRLVTPAASTLVILSSGVGGLSLWIFLLATEVWLAIPRGWSAIDWRTMVWCLPLMLLAGLVFWKTRRLALLPFLAASFSIALLPLRDHFRSPIYDAASRGVAYDVNPTIGVNMASYPIWQTLDQSGPHRIALFAGWDESGHNWLDTPLLGSRLQNEVTYVPPSRDGSLVDYRLPQELVTRASFRAWVQRLCARNIDVIVALTPPTLETAWVEGCPEMFAPMAASANGYSHAYAFDTANAPGLIGLCLRKLRR